MFRQVLRSKAILAVIFLVVVAAFVFNGTIVAYALKPKSTVKDDRGRDELTEKMFGYGFAGTEGPNFAHDKIFKVKAAVAFSEGRAPTLYGHHAETDLDKIATEFIKQSGAVGVEEKDVVTRLQRAKEFLDSVFTDNFIERVVTEIAKINEAEVQADIKKGKADKSALPFLRLIKKIAAIKNQEARLKEARKAIVDDTRFVSFIFGNKGKDPYLFNVGNILSKEYRAWLTHIGTYPYAGSETIEGGPRTIYTTLGRISGLIAKGQAGIETAQEIMLHEFTIRASGQDTELPRATRAKLEKMNAEIDKTYHEEIKEIATEVNEEGPVVVSSPKVTITKYRTQNDLGVKEVTKIYGSSKVHPDVPKGSGQKITLSFGKADVGSIGGHGTAPGIMLEAVAEVWMKAAEQGLILDFFVTRVGDDISVTVTHIKGKDHEQIHKLYWEGFLNATVVARDLGYYAAGQDLLAEAFSGNIRGAGPGIAEMEFIERPAEPVIFGQADKTAPGAFNNGLWEIVYSPNTTWRALGKGQSQRIKVGMLDFDYNNHQGRHIWFKKADYDDAFWYGGFPDRYTYDNIMLDDDTEFAAVSAQRLSVTAGEYIGKDDPVFMMRSQSEFPAVGEITSPFLKGEYVVPGWMRGSDKGPWLPVSLDEAKIGIYDGPPLLSMWSFNINNGRLVGFYDLFAANPAIRYVQDRRAKRAVEMLEQPQAFTEMNLRLGQEEIEYQKGPELMEKRLVDQWEAFEDSQEKTEQKAVDATWDNLARQVAAQKTEEQRRAIFSELWGDLRIFAHESSKDVHYVVPSKVMRLHTAKKGKAYPILVNHETLLKQSPDGIMALQGILEQLGIGNIQFVLHVNRDDVKLEELDRIVDESLEAINQINSGYTTISRDMFAAVVAGTNPEEVAKQVQDKLGTGIFQVIGSGDYADRFKDVLHVILEQAGKGKFTSVAKALRLAIELVGKDGKISDGELKKMDDFFGVDINQNNYSVHAGAVSQDVAAIVTKFALQVATRVKI